MDTFSLNQVISLPKLNTDGEVSIQRDLFIHNFVCSPEVMLILEFFEIKKKIQMQSILAETLVIKCKLHIK
jgi:hypothetical protein